MAKKVIGGKLSAPGNALLIIAPAAVGQNIFYRMIPPSAEKKFTSALLVLC
jgi:hypothetical protein